MSKDSQLAVQSSQLSAPSAEPSVGLMLQTMIERGVTSDNVAALTQLMGLHERILDRQSAQEYARALVELQAEMPAVKAIKAVPNNDGTARYRYAPYEEIMAQARPFLTKHRFSLAFDTEVADGRVTSICNLTHASGHSKATRYAVRIGDGPPKSSESQKDGAAYTYAKRGALCAALNIVVEAPDDDARNEGAPITAEQAEDLRRRVKATKADEAKFLSFAGAATFEEISETMLDQCDSVLRKREAKMKAEANGGKEPGETGKDLF